MNSTTQETDLAQAAALLARNQEVEKAYHKIIKETSALLQSFEGKKYRSEVKVDHSSSGKETNLIHECITFFWNITLTKNRMGYSMIYFTADKESITKFGQRLSNRALRQIFKCTMQEKNKQNVEDSIRINEPGAVQNFYLSRLANGDNPFTTISEIEFRSAN